MRKLFFILLTLLPATMYSQYSSLFYHANELNAQLRVWDSEADVDYLVDHGKPVSWTYSFHTATNRCEMYCTYAKDGKFLTLGFNSFRIYLCEGAGVATDFGQLFDDMFSYFEYYSFFSGFKFEKIVYDIWWNRILIPIGTDPYSGMSYAISVYFEDNSTNIKEMSVGEEEFNESDTKYYNMQGQQVDLENAKGQIIIKTDGKKSKKIINR